jgi:ATP-binding cassette, subfamily F, member 1
MQSKKGRGKKGNDDAGDPIKATKGKNTVPDEPVPATVTSKSKKFRQLRADLKPSDDDEKKPAKPRTETTSAPTTPKAGGKKKGKGKKNDDGWGSDKDSKATVEEVEVANQKSKTKSKSKNKKPVNEKSSEEDEDHQDEKLHEDEDVEELVAKVEELAIPLEEQLDSEPVSEEEDPEAIAKAKKKEEEEPLAKLSHKEKKKLKKELEYKKQMESITKKGGEGHSALDDNFTISQVQVSDKKLALMENAVDIKVENFSISASGKSLLTSANLLIANGRRYGLVGPNG